MIIVLEGVDGTGKSSIAERLQQLIGPKSAIARMPGATPLGQHLRKLHKSPTSIDPSITDIDPYSEQILMAADFSACMHWISTLPKDTTIIFDRFNPISAVIYGNANEADLKWLQQMIMATIPNYLPLTIDHCYILHAPYETIKARRQQRSKTLGAEQCRIESRGDEFLRKVWENYHGFLQSSYKPVPIINGREINVTGSLDDIVVDIWKDLKEKLRG